MKRTAVFLAVLAFCVCSCTTGRMATAEGKGKFGRASSVDSLVALQIEPGGPGCAAAVFKDGKIVFKRGYGMANLDYGIPVTPSTVFDIASISKQFTAACILMLEERGMLSLDDDIRRFVPELTDYGSRIEIRHLLHHTSGIRDWVWLMALGGIPFENIFSRQDLLRLIARQKDLAFAPGDEYKYSNSGYNLLALAVERITGETFADFVAREIFGPLGMNNTLVFDDRRMVVENRAIGYLPDTRGGYCMEHYFNPALVGSSNIHSTVEDLFLWDNNYYTNKTGVTGLTRKMEQRGVLNSGDTVDYACGLFVQEYRGLKTVGHDGDWAGFFAYMLRLPGQQFTVVCLANTQEFSPRRLCYRIADLCLAEWNGMEIPSDPAGQQEERVPVAVDPAIYGVYAGVYEQENGRKLTISEDNGRLMGCFPARHRFELLPLSETEFFLKDRDALVAFERDEHGEVIGLEWKQGRRETSYSSIKNRPRVSEATKELSGYTGEYYSDELQATYSVECGEGGLVLNTPIRSRYLMDLTGITGSDPLKPVNGDKFRFAFMDVNFQRDTAGRITGFTLVHERAGLRMDFEKL